MKIPIIGRLFEPREKRYTLNEAVSVLSHKSLGMMANSGVSVTDDRALMYSAVFACVRILSESVASLPFIVYERTGGGKRRAHEHPLYRLLHDEPNSEMSAVEFRECMPGNASLRGNAFAKIDWKNGWPVALWPLNPARMHVRREGLSLTYRYHPERGGTMEFEREEILHIKGPSPDGLMGWSPLRIAREAIGLGVAAEEYGARLFSNDARPGGVLQCPEELSDKAYQRLDETWNSRHGGLENAHKTALLEFGTEWKQIGIAPEDAQFLETRRFQVVEIARIFRIPPHMLADLERATFANIEHLGLEFVMHSLRPWLVRWEQGVNRVLFTASEKKTFYAEHLVDGLLRGDIKSRYEAYAVGRQNGWLSANDIRELENMNPVDGGDVYLVPLNMIPANDISKVPSLKDNSTRLLPVSDFEARAKEMRALRSITERNRLAQAHTRMIADMAARIVRREGVAIKREVKKQLGQRDAAGFRSWLDRFYRELPEIIQTTAKAAFLTYGEAIGNAAAEEVNAKPGMTPVLENFIHEYTQSFALRHAGSSLGQLRKVLDESEPEDAAAAIEARVDEWAEKRPDKIAGRESIQIMGAVSKFVYASAGITAIRWNAQGNESCPYCQEMDGTIVGIEQVFRQDGEDYRPEGAEPMRINGSKAHPPLHDGCVCTISAA